MIDQLLGYAYRIPVMCVDRETEKARLQLSVNWFVLILLSKPEGWQGDVICNYNYNSSTAIP